ncbi:hypothetical protein AOQ84DRAFT_364313, partial [Glonium stellatum]
FWDETLIGFIIASRSGSVYPASVPHFIVQSAQNNPVQPTSNISHGSQLAKPTGLPPQLAKPSNDPTVVISRSPGSTPVLITVSTQTFTVDPTGGLPIAPGFTLTAGGVTATISGTTLTPGGPAATISGTAISIDPSRGVVVIGPSTTYTVSLPKVSEAEKTAIMTIGSTIITAISKNGSIIVKGSTLDPLQPLATFASGIFSSLVPVGVVLAGSTTATTAAWSAPVAGSSIDVAIAAVTDALQFTSFATGLRDLGLVFQIAPILVVEFWLLVL